MDIRSTRTLHTGRSMPIMGIGTWQLSINTPHAIANALRLGFAMIDTSGDYGTQPGIAEGIALSGRRRDSFYIVTKVEETDDAYKAAKENLRQLEIDTADLMLIHRPPKTGAGEDLWRGLMQARDEGFIKDIGVSNYSEDQIQTLIDATGETPVVNQIEWSPFGWSQYMLDFCRAKGIIIQAYSPLTRRERMNHQTLKELATMYRKTPAQLLLRWALQKGVVPLPKANQVKHMRQDVDIFDFELSAKDMITLDNLNESYSALGLKPAYEQ